MRIFTSLAIILGCSFGNMAQAQCPDVMYFLGIGGSYFFYNYSTNVDICTTNPPATITVFDMTAFCGPATFTASGSCLPVGASSPPLLGQGYAQNDPLCTDPQIITPLEVVWDGCTCIYDGPAGQPYTLQSSDCCTPTLNIPDIPIANGTYQAGVNIVSTGFILPNGDVNFKAGAEICLDSGFEIIVGGKFEATIEACQ